MPCRPAAPAARCTTAHGRMWARRSAWRRWIGNWPRTAAPEARAPHCHGPYIAPSPDGYRSAREQSPYIDTISARFATSHRGRIRITLAGLHQIRNRFMLLSLRTRAIPTAAPNTLTQDQQEYPACPGSAPRNATLSNPQPMAAAAASADPFPAGWYYS